MQKDRKDKGWSGDKEVEWEEGMVDVKGLKKKREREKMKYKVKGKNGGGEKMEGRT